MHICVTQPQWVKNSHGKAKDFHKDVYKEPTGCMFIHHQVSNISHTLAGYKIVDHSDVVAAPPVGTAPTTSSFST